MIFTNQAGIGLGHITAAALTGKVSDVVERLGVPVQAFVASADDLHRKPATGMWSKFVADHNEGVTPDLSLSVFVGDAAGRQKGWDGQLKTRKDHSVSDRKFAHNVGLRFATPEPYFLGHAEAPYKLDTLDIASFFTSTRRPAADSDGEGGDDGDVVVTGQTTTTTQVVVEETNVGGDEEGKSTSTLMSSVTISSIATSSVGPPTLSPSAPSAPLPAPKYAVSHQELVLFVGSPASGKSTFARTHFLPYSYQHVNQVRSRSAAHSDAAAPHPSDLTPTSVWL